MHKLVNIITPCYNGSGLVHRLLDSVLAQDYPAIEHIVINDGSTDNTAELVHSYVDRYESAGKKLTLLDQENKGQASALNAGLKICQGEYLTWPDADDFYNSPTAIRKFVETFEALPKDFGMVRSDGIALDEHSLTPMYRLASISQQPGKESLFEDCLFENGFWFAPGCYMISRTALDTTVAKREIFESRGGQNWQLYLPILFRYKCRFISDAPFSYLVRKGSHSRKLSDFPQHLGRLRRHEEIIVQTLQRMNMHEEQKQRYLRAVRLRYLRKYLLLSWQYDNKKVFLSTYQQLQQRFPDQIRLRIRAYRLLMNFPLLKKYISRS